MPARTKVHTGANYLAEGDNNVICDRTGFKVKASNVRKEWNGFYVRNESWEARNQQDLLRGFPDRQAANIQRPGNEDVFLSTNEVKPEDL